MDYINGGTLRQLLLKKVKLEETWAKKIISEILIALNSLHENNYIYRDLKPENVMLNVNGHVVLIDLGFCKLNYDLNQSRCGSNHYIAPEMILRQRYNETLDWYQLGVLIHQVLTGKQIFEGTFEEMIPQIKNGVESINEDISEEAKNLIKRLMRKNPKERLGNQGVEEIKSHPWFKEINWNAVKKQEMQMPKVEETPRKFN